MVEGPSKVKLSIALCASNKIVPPGVSYTPLDFIPTVLFSTKSFLPIPFLPPIKFKIFIAKYGESLRLFIFNKFPFLKVNVIFSPLLLALLGVFVILYIFSSGLFQGSSKIFPSYEMCNKLASIEYGGSFFLLPGTGILFL